MNFDKSGRNGNEVGELFLRAAFNILGTKHICKWGK